MTSKVYLVSWLGKGNIIWTPLQQESGGLAIDPALTGPLRSILDSGAANSDVLKAIQRAIDPSMAALGSIQSIVSVAAGLTAVTVGLQIATLVVVCRMSQKIDRIDQKLKALGGKFELHFLDQSIDHFVKWHDGVAGLVPSAAGALEEDCYNALDELIASKNLRIPGYLKLKLACIADAVDTYSRFLYAVIHNGSVPQIAEDRIKGWLAESKSIQKGGLVGGFVPQRKIIDLWMQLLSDKGWKPDLDDSRLGKALERSNFDRAWPIVLLALQLNQALALSGSIEDKVQASIDLAIVVKAV